MNWAVRIADDAQLFVKNLPDKARRQVCGSISRCSAALLPKIRGSWATKTEKAQTL
jgi:hypothetical protein